MKSIHAIHTYIVTDIFTPIHGGKSQDSSVKWILEGTENKSIKEKKEVIFFSFFLAAPPIPHILFTQRERETERERLFS